MSRKSYLVFFTGVLAVLLIATGSIHAATVADTTFDFPDDVFGFTNSQGINDKVKRNSFLLTALNTGLGSSSYQFVNGGVCLGMVVTAKEYYKARKQNPSMPELNEACESPYQCDITVGANQVLSSVKYNLDNLVGFFSDLVFGGQQKNVAKDLISDMQDTMNPQILLVSNDQGYAHALLVYSVEASGNAFIFKVYDPNSRRAKEVIYDRKDNEFWGYTSGRYTYTKFELYQ